MKKRLFGILVLFAVVAFGEEGFHEHKCWGHPNNPLIPGTEWKVHDNERPQPPRVVPGAVVSMPAPSDAKVLFDGTTLDHFKSSTSKLVDGVIRMAGSVSTKEAYGDCQLHVEWRAPATLNTNKTSSMGNSGIFLMGKYEVQIFDSYSCNIYADGSTAAIYGQTPPMFNVSAKPGKWQSFDIFFTAPVFDGEKLVKPAFITMLHNGVFVHVNTELMGPTKHNKTTAYMPHPARLPFYFQGHGSPVEYRNIWVRDLAE